MVDSSWTPHHQHQHRDNRGWASFDSDRPRRSGSASWLAKLLGVSSELPTYLDEKPSGASEFSQRLRGLKRTLFRRLPAMGWSRQRGHRLSLSQGQPSVDVPSSATVRFILMCCLWYTTSALSSNTGKSIMTTFRYPVTLTFIQFGFVAAYCLLFMSPVVQFSKLRWPTKAIFETTFPMGVFQVGGHIFSSMAISRIHVSTVHTIKALSPLFTVAAYALLFGVSYSSKTYISLLPLTFGVMLACSFDVDRSSAVGILCAFGSAIIFVTQNIYFKKVVPSNGGQSSHKLDKLNLLFYSSSMAFILMIPIWMYYDLPVLLAASEDHIVHPTHGHETPHSVTYYFIANGTVHFAQNIIAFIILASTSPVTYSIASLIKRVAVICIAIVWFAQSVHPIQAVGITMTFVGLYMYNNNAKGDVEKGEHKMRRVEAARDLVLPTTKADLASDGEATPPRSVTPAPISGMAEVSVTSAYGRVVDPSHHHPPHGSYPRAPAPSTYSSGPFDQTPPPSYSRSHPQTNLHIKITPPPANNTVSPVDSYPSPPPSLDSPPLSAVHQTPHAQPPWTSRQRRASVVASHQRMEAPVRRPVAVAS